MPYPRIPDWTPQAPDESHHDHGLRAFRYLVAERVPAGLLDDASLAAALHFSQLCVTAKDTAPAALDLYHAVRLDIQATQRRRLAEQLDAENGASAALQARQATIGPDSGRDGGAKDRQPQPPTRPTPPAGAARPTPPAQWPAGPVTVQRQPVPVRIDF